MSCVDNMLESLDLGINHKKRKRDDTILIVRESKYNEIIKMFGEMKDKINELDSNIRFLNKKIEYLEDENNNKSEIIKSINNNYLTKDDIKKIKIYSNIELCESSYIN